MFCLQNPPQLCMRRAGRFVCIAALKDLQYIVAQIIVLVGVCSCVDLIGTTLGTGAGDHRGLHGLLINYVQSTETMTEVGEILNASESQHADLFRGLRGIITTALCKPYLLINESRAISVDMSFSISNHESV